MYALFRALHVVIAIFAMGPHFVAPILLRQINRNPESAPSLLPLLVKVGNLPKHGAPMMLLTGVLIIWSSSTGWSLFQQPWLIAALVLFFATMIYGKVKAEPVGKQLEEAVARGGLKAEEVGALARQLNMNFSVMGVGLVAIVLLMIFRPSF